MFDNQFSPEILLLRARVARVRAEWHGRAHAQFQAVLTDAGIAEIVTMLPVFEASLPQNRLATT